MRLTCGFTFLLWICDLLIGHLILVHGAELRCYRTLNDYEVAPLDKPEALLSTTCYNCSRSNLVYTHGFNRGPDTYDTVQILSAALDFTDMNVFLLDWEKEARSNTEFLGTVGNGLSYVATALPETVKVGKALGEALLKMSECSFDFEKTELIGHSLGAHVIGNAGRQVIDGGKIMALLTGLDPAGPFFDSFLPLYPKLDYTCGRHVRAYHTDPGSYGTNTSEATADYYPNYGNFISGPSADQVQPGCPKGVFPLLSSKDVCSHDRSWELMIETWKIKGSLLAVSASDYYAWVADENCLNSENISALGEDNTNAKGNYFLTTNGEPPYGRYRRGLCASSTSTPSQKILNLF